MKFSELSDDILLCVFLVDVLQIRRWRLVCKRLHILSVSRTVWIEALNQFKAIHPLELPIGSYNSEDLERIALRMEKLRLNWANDHPEVISVRTFEQADFGNLLLNNGPSPPLMILPGGRWLLKQPGLWSTTLIAYDLDSPGLRGEELVRLEASEPDPTIFFMSNITIHQGSVDFSSGSFEFDLGIQHRRHSDLSSENHALLWRVTLRGDTYKTSRLQAEHIVTFDMRPAGSLMLSQDVAICMEAVGSQIDLYRWKEVNGGTCPVTSFSTHHQVFLPIEIRHTETGQVVVILTDLIEVYVPPDFKSFQLEAGLPPASGAPGLMPIWTWSPTSLSTGRILSVAAPLALITSRPAMTLVCDYGLLLPSLPLESPTGTTTYIKYQNLQNMHLSHVHMGHRWGIAGVSEQFYSGLWSLGLLSYVRRMGATAAEPPSGEWEVVCRLAVGFEGYVRQVLAFDEQSGRAVVIIDDTKTHVLDFA